MALNIVIPCIFYYLSYQEIELSIFVNNGVTSVFICILTLLCYIPIKTYVSNEEDAILDVIVMDNYSLVCDIKAFSKFEYDHAVKVLNKEHHIKSYQKNVQLLRGLMKKYVQQLDYTTGLERWRESHLLKMR